MTYQTTTAAHTTQMPVSSAQTIQSDLIMPSSHGRHSAKLPLSGGIIMSFEARTRERFRVRLARFIGKERSRCQSAKEAMKSASKKIGLSALSLYRVMNNHPKAVKIEAHHYAALLMHSIGIARVAEKIRAKRRFCSNAKSLHA